MMSGETAIRMTSSHTYAKTEHEAVTAYTCGVRGSGCVSGAGRGRTGAGCCGDGVWGGCACICSIFFVPSVMAVTTTALITSRLKAAEPTIVEGPRSPA